MVKTKKQLVKSTARTYGGTNGRRYITIHETANYARGAGAQTHANLQSNGFSASWHWQVDDTQAIQSFPHTAQCWHAGDGRGNGNLNSIGIEICVNSDSNFGKAVENAAELTRKIMAEENIPASNVVQHHNWSGKNCPTNLRNGSKGINWNDFKSMIKGGGKVSVGKSPKPSTKPAKKQTKWTPISGNWTGQTLKRGHHGKPVEQLQRKLANNNPPFYPNKGAKNNGIDSYFGGDTEDAVRRFQSYYGLAVDGLAGKKTFAKLGGKTTKKKASKSSNSSAKLPAGVLRRGNRGEKVKRLQRALNKANFKVGKVDGIYGAKTEDAVRRFQSVYDAHNVDGVYGPRTKTRLAKKI